VSRLHIFSSTLGFRDDAGNAKNSRWERPQAGLVVLRHNAHISEPFAKATDTVERFSFFSAWLSEFFNLGPKSSDSRSWFPRSRRTAAQPE
jgi:hypothetical protein